MPFREIKRDEEGNPVIDKKTEKPVYKIVYYKVKYNAAYFPRLHTHRFKAENPTC